LEAFGEGAKHQAREYTILAFNVQVDSMELDSQDRAIKEIYQQNPQLQGQVEIVRLGWAKKTLVQKRAFAALHIGIATPEQANMLIKHGLYFENKLYRCKPFFRDCQVNQCVRCHEYTHMAKHCPNRARCGFCASMGHRSQECIKKDKREAYQRALYKSPDANHPAWARECPIRVQKQREARQAYNKRPTLFQEKKGVQEPKEKEAIVTPTSSKDSSSTRGTTTPRTIEGSEDRTTLSQNDEMEAEAISAQILVSNTQYHMISPSQEQLHQSDEEFIEAPAPKRRQGRPTTQEVLSRASKGSQDIRSTFQSTGLAGLAGASQGSLIEGYVNCSYQEPGTNHEISPAGLGKSQGQAQVAGRQRSMSEITL
jgi:hypothetical protein